MYTTKTVILSFMVLLFMLGSTPDLTAMEGSPAIPEQAKKLQMFVGTWVGTGTMSMGDMKHDMKFTHISEPTADGWGVYNTEINETEGMATYRGTNIFGYDPGGGLTHLYSVSNYGDCHDHKGKWSDDKSVRLQYDGVWEGKPMTEVVEITFDNPKQYRFTVTGNVGGQQTMSVEGVMKKK